MQLVICAKRGAGLLAVQEKLEAYRFRQDVQLLINRDERTQLDLQQAAYALLYQPMAGDAMMPVARSMQAGVPVIYISNGEGQYPDAVAKTGSEVEAIGNAIIRIYKDETYRSTVIEQAKLLVRSQSVENSAQQLYTIMESSVSK